VKPGDLYRIHVPPSAHPQDDYLHGMLVIILGDKNVRVNNHEYIKCLGDRIRMFPVRWLEALQ
jgi:hypothetical protein